VLAGSWKWISKRSNQKTLAWIGGAIAIVAGALWKVYTYQPPARAPSSSEVATQRREPAQEVRPVLAARPAQEAKAETGGVAVNAQGDAQVIIQRSNP
jgi:hypothetical protein